MDSGFWAAADALLGAHSLIIDRPGGSRHPKFPGFLYPLDYGYLDGTQTADGGSIDVWRGSGLEEVTGVLCQFDLLKRDAELKLLVGCSAEEAELVYAAATSEFTQPLLILRLPQTT